MSCQNNAKCNISSKLDEEKQIQIGNPNLPKQEDAYITVVLESWEISQKRIWDLSEEICEDFVCSFLCLFGG